MGTVLFKEKWFFPSSSDHNFSPLTNAQGLILATASSLMFASFFISYKSVFISAPGFLAGEMLPSIVNWGASCKSKPTPNDCIGRPIPSWKLAPNKKEPSTVTSFEKSDSEVKLHSCFPSYSFPLITPYSWYIFRVQEECAAVKEAEALSE